MTPSTGLRAMRPRSSRNLGGLACLFAFLLGGCAATRTYARSTLAPLSDAYACGAYQLEELGYALELEDPVGGVLQARRQITGLVERARRGAARATEVITVGLAGGSRVRFDELTVTVYRRHYPQGNTIEVTAGMLTVTGEEQARTPPTDQARADARALLEYCAPRD